MKNINIKLLFKVILSVSLIVFLFYKLDITVLLSLDIKVVPYLLLSCLITSLALLIQSYRYGIMVSYFLNKSINTFIIFKYYMIGMFFNIFLPGAIGGDAVRIKKLVTNHKINYKKSTAITLGERFTGLYGLILLISISLFFQNFPDQLNFNKYVPSVVLKLSPFITILSIPVLSIILKKFNVHFTNAFAFKTVFVILLAQMGDILIAYLFSKYLGLDVSFTSYIFIMPIVYISTVLPISLGGLGVREGVFSGLLTLYGVDVSLAIIISLLMYFTKLIVGIIGYVIYLRDK